MTGKRLRTRLCDMLSIEYPIIAAGMGGMSIVGIPTASVPRLAAAVSNAGGMGVLGALDLSADELRAQIAEMRQLTNKPFGVDVVLPVTPPLAGSRDQIKAGLPKEQVDLVGKLRQEFAIPHRKAPRHSFIEPQGIREQITVALEERVPVLAIGLGDPGEIVPEAHARGTKVIGLVGTVKQARRLAQAGVDIIVAQGSEAGGHTGMIGTFVLVPQVADAVAPTPVLAAGGIADGRGLVAALALGAAGVWVGTAFLVSDEAGFDDQRKTSILEAAAEDARITRMYTGKPERVITNPLVQAWERSAVPALPMPLQSILVEDLIAGIIEAGQEELLACPAGQVAGMLKQRKSAREVVDNVVAEAVTILKERLPNEVTLAG